MKQVLGRVEKHTFECSISNLPGGQNDCPTCNKWQSMVKLREHYRRRLILYIQKTYPNDSLQTRRHATEPPPPQQKPPPQQPPPPPQQQQRAAAADAPGQGANGLGANRARFDVGKAPAPALKLKARPPDDVNSRPPAMPLPMSPQPSGSIVPMAIGPMASSSLVASLNGGGFFGGFGGHSVDDFGDEEGDEMNDLDDLLTRELHTRDGRQVLPGQGAGAKRPRQAPERRPLPMDGLVGWGDGGSSAALDDDDDGLASFADADADGRFGDVPVDEARVPGGAHASKFQRTELGNPVKRSHADKPMPSANPKEPHKAPLSSRSGRALRQSARKEESDEQTLGGSSDAMSDGSWMDGDVDLVGFDHLAKEGKMAELIEHGASIPIGHEPTDRNEECVAIGMNVIVDPSRQASGPKPTEFDPLETHAPPLKTNAAVVTAVHADGTCDVQLVCSCDTGGPKPATWRAKASDPPAVCQECHSGAVLERVDVAQRQICCSTCLHVNLPMEPPLLRCSGCYKQIRSGQTYFRDPGLRLNIRVCHGCHADMNAGTQPEYLKDVELRHETFEKCMWNAKEDQAFDNYIMCEGGCERWFHYICALFPDPAQLPAEWKIDKQRYICNECHRKGVALDNATRLLALQYRRAAALRTHPLSDSIEAYVAQTMKKLNVSVDSLTVRVVSSKRFNFPAFGAMKARYGADYPDEFPYESRVVLAFQEVGGRDVCFFAMYVQEYGPECPAPNTNRAYISYLDSVRYLQTSPPEQRTLVYHAMVNGYLRSARDRGFDFAHIWVAPPQAAGDEYIFHSRPVDPRHGTRPMSMAKLRDWYEKMLNYAVTDGIVSTYEDIQTHVEHLTSIRDFPLFEGDFFPDHLKTMLEPPPVPARAAPPGLAREASHVLVEQMKKQTKSVRKRFLIATLNQTDRRLMPPPDAPGRIARTAHGGSSSEKARAEAVDFEISHPLVDKRMDFLQLCIDRHWQFNELRRAHFATMMILANLGGEPHV